MILASRKVVYTFFIGILALCLITLLIISFFSQGLEVKNPSVSLSGDSLVLKMSLSNTSKHKITGIKVLVKNGDGAWEFYLNDRESRSELSPGGSYEFIESIPLAKSYNYSVQVMAPFNKTIPLNFELKQSTVDPVKAEVVIARQIYLNEKYTYSINLCNVSDSSLEEVIWLDSAEDGYFSETFYERTVSLPKGECKTIYSTLTPIKKGTVEINFVMRVGPVEKKSSKLIDVVERAV